MRNKHYLLAFFVSVFLLFTFNESHAVTVSIEPVSQTVPVNSSFDVNLTILGLGNGAAPSLSTFDIDIGFDSNILTFNSVVFGDPLLGDQLDLFGLGSLTDTTIGSGVVNIFELSFDLPSDLDSLQADSFVLATMNFGTLSNGSSSLDLTINALGDALGNPLVASTTNGSITVVPLPSALFMFIPGLISLLSVSFLRSKVILNECK